MAEIKELVKKRGSLKARLTVFANFVISLPTESLTSRQIMELELRVKRMDDVLSGFDLIQGEIELLTSDEDEEVMLRERCDFENAYFDAMSKAKTLLSECTFKHANSYPTAHNASPSFIADESSELDKRNNAFNCSSKIKCKLPVICVPKYNGSYEDWLEFRDTFVSLIHNNDNIDNINKFHYLKSSLEGSASLVIQSLEISSDNYNNAWQLICERYDNKRLLVRNHVTAIFNIKCINKESSSSLRCMIDAFCKNLRALETLKEPTKHWDTLLIYIATSKLDSVTRRHWEENFPLLGTVTFDCFIEFLRNRSDLLETITMQSSVFSSQSQRSTSGGGQMRKVGERGFVAVDEQSEKSSKSQVTICPKCTGHHYLFECKQFLTLSNQERADELPRLNVCFNCLKSGHYLKNCWRGGCKICHKRHNTLVHIEKISSGTPPTTDEASPSITLVAQESIGQILLSTALVRVMCYDGTTVLGRAILDSGSTACFISESFCKKLRLPLRQVNTTVTGVNNIRSKLSVTCNLTMLSHLNEFKFETTCFVIPTVTCDLPVEKIDVNALNIPLDIELADPQFYLPSTIDLLLGANVFWNLLESGRLDLGPDKPVVCETKIGWLVSGYCPSTKYSKAITCNLIVDEKSVDDSLTRFWQLDECAIRSETSSYSAEQRACEDHFVKHTRRLSDGRFCVRLPLKLSDSMLGDSYEKAKKCLVSLERRLRNDSDLKSLYVDFMKEYENLGDMTKVTDPSLQTKGHFLPHHGVLRSCSLTTKLRVVFNASSPSSTGISINDLQMVGPTIQDDIVAILLRFRHYRYVFSADIEKMYRRILVDINDRHLQQILWRLSPAEPFSTYQLNTVTYGTASAPFLAIRCLKELSLQCDDPVVAKSIARDFYVDDFLSGCSHKEEATKLITGVTNMLKSAGMYLRKWRSNDPSLINSNTTETRDLNLGNIYDAKTLGLGWNSNSDELYYTIDVTQAQPPNRITKRLILSVISKVFDPLGLVAPCIVQSKILLQRLWLYKLSWDDEVPSDVILQWQKIIMSLSTLNNLRIPRLVIVNHTYFEFHVFSDASEGAYGACLYIRSVDTRNNKIDSRLLCAKSRVSPVKPITIPKLELCGALIGSRLCDKAFNSFRLQPKRCVFWTDSTIVLGWLRMLPSRLKVYVRNRVSDILSITGQSPWRHVPSHLNPADYISRGIDANKIAFNELWWSGPNFLKNWEENWPKNIYSEQKQLPEVKSEVAMTIIERPNNIINAEYFSNFTRLIRVTAYVIRFVNNIKVTNCDSRERGFLKTQELQKALNYHIKLSQRESFSCYNKLLNNQVVDLKDPLVKLNPFIDVDGILRVGGRLNNSEFNYFKKHPIILCSNHHFTKVLFMSEHQRLMHIGPQNLLYSIRQKYWPIRGRHLARATCKKCVLCARFNGKTVTPIMGNLPIARTNLEYPFQVVGVDYAGPILTASKRGRGCSLKKSYIVIFVCFATRAIHLEVVSDLSADGYIDALHRFISRRGLPTDIYSDNGTQFVGACNELKTFLKYNSDPLSERAANEGIRFHFLPPYSPHFAGMAEAGVKSSKYHLRRILGNCHLTFEELCTVTFQIEAILNSRPISPLSCDSDDLLPLTPGHFLIGRPLTEVPSPNYIDVNTNRLNRYQRIQQLRQHFWTRWSKEYISELQERQKWRKCKGTLKEGMMVVIKEDNVPPMKWKLGRIVAVYPGQDEIARVADIKTSGGILRRSFSKICPLPI